MQSLYRKKQNLTDKAVYTTKNELFDFLSFLDSNLIIQEFLRHDSSFLLADKYLIAMVFIYFKRAQLNSADFTYLNFFAGLCLARSMEEDVELNSEIYAWALGDEMKNELPRLLELKALLWEAMDYRAAVSRHCCKKIREIRLVSGSEFPGTEVAQVEIVKEGVEAPTEWQSENLRRTNPSDVSE